MSIAKIGLLIAASALAASSVAAAANDWRSRPLYVFAPKLSNTSLKRQQQTIAAVRDALKARDVVVIYVIGDAVTAELGAPPDGSAAKLRARFSVPQGAFRAILVGKDGGIKLSSHDAISADRLSGVIDAMPMRRREMRRKG